MAAQLNPRLKKWIQDGNSAVKWKVVHPGKALKEPFFGHGAVHDRIQPAVSVFMKFALGEHYGQY
jgi:hypothetical protein